MILVPTVVTSDGAAHQSLKLSATGDPHLNPILRHVLVEDHGALDLLDSAIEEILQTEEFSFRVAFDFFRHLTENLKQIPEFRIKRVAALGNFSYAMMPMVRDLSENVEVLAQNEIVAAVAGDKQAREVLASRFVDASGVNLDAVPPADEFLIRDADASQHRAILRVIGGESIVIQGPPGTGKSQTIANLIGSLTARGKRVLFVAEKRAAIEAVIVSELAVLGLYMTTARWLDEEASVVRERLRRLSSERDIVARIPRILDIESLLADRGMREILESVWDGTMRPELAAKVHEHAWLQTIVDEVSFTDPDFASFAGSKIVLAIPCFDNRSSSSMNNSFTIRRMTSRGVKCSPAVSLESSEKRRISSSYR